MRDGKAESSSITLERPISIIRDGKKEMLSVINLRKPTVNDLRGVSISALLNMDTDAATVVAMRVCKPRLRQADVMSLDVADMTQIASEIMSYLVPQWAVAEVTNG